MNGPIEPLTEPVVTAQCPHCGSEHPVREQVLGKLAKCTNCGQRFVLRKPAQAPPPMAMPVSKAKSNPKATAVARAKPVARQVAEAIPTATKPPVTTPAPAASSVVEPPPFVPPQPAATEATLQLPMASETASAGFAAPAPTQALTLPPRPASCRVLAIVARVMEVFAAVSFILGTLWSLVAMIQALTGLEGTGLLGTAIMLVGGQWLVVIGTSAALLIGAQLIRVLLHIEQHARRIAATSQTKISAQASPFSPPQAGLEPNRETT